MTAVGLLQFSQGDWRLAAYSVRSPSGLRRQSGLAGSTLTRVRHFFIALIAARWGIMRVILLLLDVDWVGRDEMKLAYVHYR